MQTCLISQIGKSLKNHPNQSFAGSRSRQLWFISVPRALCGFSISNRWVSLISVYSLCFSGCSRRELSSLGAFLYALGVVSALLASGQGSLHSRCISLRSRRFLLSAFWLKHSSVSWLLWGFTPGGAFGEVRYARIFLLILILLLVRLSAFFSMLSACSSHSVFFYILSAF